MMQSELLLQPFHDQNGLNTNFYASEEIGFPSLIMNSTILPSSDFQMKPDDCIEYPFLGYDHMQNPSLVENASLKIEVLDDVCRWLCDVDQEMEEIPSEISLEIEGSDIWSPGLSIKSMEACDAIEIESKIGMGNLLKAYADAVEMGQRELAKVIVKCVSEKASPNGPALERVAFNLFTCADNQGQEYLKQASRRNFKPAFRAFYDIFPYGRFAHLTANSAIVEAIPTHVDSVHMVDFDMGEGTQWPPVIEAVARRRKSMTITSVKLEEHDSGFEETKRHLCNYARGLGLNLKVEEMELSQMENELEGRYLTTEFLAFNCMTGLPHMGRRRRMTQVIEFIKIAKELLAENNGILTIGDGENSEGMGKSSGYASFFDGYLAHYKALYESIERGFPSCLTEARITMETLFITPFVSSVSWFQKWEEGREDVVPRKDLGLKGWRISRQSSNEARELVKEGESRYSIRVEGEGDCENEMVLEWKGTPLVRVSVWIKVDKDA